MISVLDGYAKMTLSYEIQLPFSNISYTLGEARPFKPIILNGQEWQSKNITFIDAEAIKDLSDLLY